MGKKKARRRSILKDPNWRIFKINWRPPNFGVINKDAVKAAKKKEQKRDDFTSSFHLMSSKGQISFYTYAVVQQKEGACYEKEGKFSEKFEKYLAQAIAAKLQKWQVISSETRVNIRDCLFSPLYIFEITGENVVAPVKKIATSKDSLIFSVEGFECIKGLIVTKTILRGTYDEVRKISPETSEELRFKPLPKTAAKPELPQKGPSTHKQQELAF